MMVYIKKQETNLNNPEVTVKDSRLVELDKIVSEVKQSEEWEAVRMNILEIGKEIGVELGEKQLLKKQVRKKLEKGYTVDKIADMLEAEVDTIRELIEELKMERTDI